MVRRLCYGLGQALLIKHEESWNNLTFSWEHSLHFFLKESEHFLGNEPRSVRNNILQAVKLVYIINRC